jgi:hypothetical protein
MRSSKTSRYIASLAGMGRATSGSSKMGSIYKWTPGGAPMEPGEYTVNVDVSLNGENTNWKVDFTVTLP